MSSRFIRGPMVLSNTTVQTGTGDFTFINESCMVIDKASGAATQVTLPASPFTGQVCFVKDGKGDASTNNITVIGAASATIDGAASFVISTDYACIAFHYNGTEWGAFTSGGQAGTAFTERVTTTDGVASGTARVVGGLAYSNTAASTAVTGSTTAEQVFSTGYTIPANTLKAGTVVKVRAQGIATTTQSTDAVAYKLYIGGSGGTALITAASTDAANSDTFQMECLLVCRTAGTTGTFVSTGTYKVSSAEGTMVVKDDITASTTVNTTANQAIAVTATWNVANATNSCRLDILTVEIT